MTYRVFPFGEFFKRFSSKTVEKLGVDFLDVRDHGADDGASFARGVRSGAHAPEAMEDDAGEGVDHRREGGDGKNVASDFDGALLGGALDLLEALGVGHRADVPDVIEDGAGVGDQKSGKFAVVVPSAGDGGRVEFLTAFVEEE